jgi:hypothetical protein
MRRGRGIPLAGPAAGDMGGAAPLPGRCLPAALRDATPGLTQRLPLWAHSHSEAYRCLMVRLTVRLTY